ncbi:helix-turn-helix transcriptional regulator, partial [Ensifer sp. ENS02]|uniref:helix-turn-helix domain-containing protein n=1 Tax=Ensifer sp. ENS02 TaxID=2769290 RepID=UPI00178227A9
SLPDQERGARPPSSHGAQDPLTPLSHEKLLDVRNAATAVPSIVWEPAKSGLRHASVQASQQARDFDVNVLSNPKLHRLQVAASAQWLCIAGGSPVAVDVQHVTSQLRPEHRFILLAIPGAEDVAHQLATRTGITVQFLDRLGTLQIEPGVHPRLSLRNSGPWKKAVPIRSIEDQDPTAGVLDEEPSQRTDVAWHQNATPGARLKALRGEHGLTQKALVEALKKAFGNDVKVSIPKIKDIESGRDSGRLLWGRLAALFKVEPSLLSGVLWKYGPPGTRLRALRIERGFTQEELGTYLQLSRDTINGIESGHTSGDQHWGIIAVFFGVARDELTGTLAGKETARTQSVVAADGAFDLGAAGEGS